MKGKGQLLRHTVNNARTLAKPLTPLPLVELTGDRRVLIENHKGVTVYSLNEIRVSVSYGQLCLQGSGMQLAHMTKERLLITGCIDSIQLCRRCR